MEHQKPSDQSGRYIFWGLSIQGPFLFAAGVGLFLLPIVWIIKTAVSGEITIPDMVVIACVLALCGTVLVWLLSIVGVPGITPPAFFQKNVWSVLILSILTSGATLFSETLIKRDPYQGKWQIEVISNENGKLNTTRSIVMSYSNEAQTYYGFSDVPRSQLSDLEKIYWIGITHFDPKDRQLAIKYQIGNGDIKAAGFTMESVRHEKELKSVNDPDNSGLRIIFQRQI